MKKHLKKASLTVATACLVAACMCSAGWAHSDLSFIELKSHQGMSVSDSPPSKFNEVSSVGSQEGGRLYFFPPRTEFKSTSARGDIHSEAEHGIYGIMPVNIPFELSIPNFVRIWGDILQGNAF